MCLVRTVIKEASAHLVEEPVHGVEPGIVGRHGAPAEMYLSRSRRMCMLSSLFLTPLNVLSASTRAQGITP